MLDIGGFNSASAGSAMQELVDVIQLEPLAVWLAEHHIAWRIDLKPRLSRRQQVGLAPVISDLPIWTATLFWQLEDDLATMLELKFYPLPTPRESIGRWTISH